MEEVAINSKWLPQVQSTWRKNCHCDAFYFRARRFCTVIPYVLQNLAKAEALTFDSVAKYHYKWRATGSLSKDKCFADLDWGDLRLRDLTVQNRFAFSRWRQSNKAPPYPAPILFFYPPQSGTMLPRHASKDLLNQPGFFMASNFFLWYKQTARWIYKAIVGNTFNLHLNAINYRGRR